jgi:hypothetical protein
MSSPTRGPLRPLQYNAEVLASLIYLARQGNTEQQRRYMNCASNVVEEMQHHPKLREQVKNP